MNGPAVYLQFGFILISLANLIVISLMVLIFALAIVLKLPGKPRLSTLEDMQGSVGEVVGVKKGEVVHS